MVLAELQSSGQLSNEVSDRLFEAILNREWSKGQVTGLLVALRLLGETSGILQAGVRALQKRSIAVEHTQPVVFDAVSVAGSDEQSLDVSVGVAIIAAAAGVTTITQSATGAVGQVGSADILAALGLAREVPSANLLDVLEGASIASANAAAHHPRLSALTGPARELGLLTVVDTLTALINPARPTHLLMGARSDDTRRVAAAALQPGSVKRAWVVHSSEGRSLVSPCASTRISVLSGSRVMESEVSPQDFGLRPAGPEALIGGTAKAHAKILEAILAGEEHPARATLLVNAAASLAIIKDTRLPEACRLAQRLIDKGKALETLRSWQRLTLQYARARQAG